MTNERIEAEIAAEIKRIEAWNNNNEPACTLCGGVEESLCSHEIRSLANYLARNRLLVEDARITARVETLAGLQVQALVKALRKTSMFLELWEDTLAGLQMSEASFDENSGLSEAQAALAPFEEVTP